MSSSKRRSLRDIGLLVLVILTSLLVMAEIGTNILAQLEQTPPPAGMVIDATLALPSSTPQLPGEVPQVNTAIPSMATTAGPLHTPTPIGMMESE
jgi:hypothetical protein